MTTFIRYSIFLIALSGIQDAQSFSIQVALQRPLTLSNSYYSPLRRSTRLSLSDEWSTFTALDDDDDEIAIDTLEYAKEEDSQERKAEVGSLREAPSIDDPMDVEPILVPPGSKLELSQETVLGVLSACRQELGTLFGYSAENRGVGITGGVDFVDLDGPMVILKLKGRYWHQRTTVLDRVANYLQQRIPEIIEVSVEDPWQLTDEANEIW